MKSDLADDDVRRHLILENRRLRELVVSLSATLLRTISREAAAGRQGRGPKVSPGLRKAARKQPQRSLHAVLENMQAEA